MLRPLRKKPKVNEYFQLTPIKGGYNLYFTEETIAKKTMNVYKKYRDNNEWILYHVKEGEKKIIDMIKRSQSYKHETKPVEKPEVKSELDAMLKFLAGKISAEEEEEQRIPKRI